MAAVLLICLAVLTMTTSAQPNINIMNPLTPKPIIIDTDLFSDVDDIGALAVANSLHNCGLADLRAIMLNTHSEYGSLAASVSPIQFSSLASKQHKLKSQSSPSNKSLILNKIQTGNNNPLLQPHHPHRRHPPPHAG